MEERQEANWVCYRIIEKTRPDFLLDYGVFGSKGSSFEPFDPIYSLFYEKTVFFWVIYAIMLCARPRYLLRL